MASPPAQPSGGSTVPASRGQVRVLYIGGLGRSGSTLLDCMLGGISGFVSAGEVRYLWQWGIRENRLCGCGTPFLECPFWSSVGSLAFGGWHQVDIDEAIALGDAVDRHALVPFMLAPQVWPAFERRMSRYLALLAPLYRAIWEVGEQRVIVDSSKAPSTAFLLRRIPDLDLRIVHLVRDSRGVAHSWTKKVKRPDTPGRTIFMHRYSPHRIAIRWAVRNPLLETMGLLGVPQTHVLYERLVADPRSEVARIARMAGQEADPENMTHIADDEIELGANHTVMGNPLRMRRGRTPLRVDEEWRTAMPLSWQRTVTAITLPVLLRYGYSPALGTRSQHKDDQAAPTPPRLGWPAVTAIIPTHHRPDLLPRAVRSVLEQRYSGPIECLLVFDGEEPRLPDVQLTDGRTLRAIYNDRTPGPAGARNTGAMSATGELVAFLDDDDEWLPDKLQLQVQALDRHPGSAVATSGVYMSNGRDVARVPRQEILTLDYVLRGRNVELHMSNLLVRRDSYLGEIGMLDESIPASYGEDYDWYIRAARRAPIVAVLRPLARVGWQHSYFKNQWEMMIPAIEHQLRNRPEVYRSRANLARLYGRVAFAHAATGHGTEARRWARRTLAVDWRQARGYLALLISFGLLKPETAIRIARAAGRGL